MTHAERSTRERRRWARAQADWPLTIALDDGHHEARLRDVSQAGVSFFLDRPVREMTLLQVRVTLPGQAREVRCHGVVVRCQRLSPLVDHYEVAVFLNEVSEADKKSIADYVATAPGA